MNQTNESVPQSSISKESGTPLPGLVEAMYAMREREKLRAEIEWELRLAKEYWLQTVQIFIVERRLRDVELFIAEDAHLLLRGVQKKAEDWNRTHEGRLSPLDVDLSAEKFREPEVLFADENLKPEILAEVAAPLVNKSKVKMTPAEAVRNAHELLMAAERYIGTLPEKKEGIKSFVSDMELGLSHRVPFAEILRSNKKDSGQLPFLPTTQKGRNAGKLSLTALKNAVKNFYEKEKKNHPQLTEEQYNRETEQDAKLQQGQRSYSTGKRMTYQEWQSQPHEAIKDCMQNSHILLQTLCTMRWERFKKHWQDQQSRTQKRKSSESTLSEKSESKANLPQSAASSPTTARKRKQ
jgi:hypothetical protein